VVKTLSISKFKNILIIISVIALSGCSVFSGNSNSDAQRPPAPNYTPDPNYNPGALTLKGYLNSIPTEDQLTSAFKYFCTKLPKDFDWTSDNYYFHNEGITNPTQKPLGHRYKVGTTGLEIIVYTHYDINGALYWSAVATPDTADIGSKWGCGTNTSLVFPPKN